MLKEINGFRLSPQQKHLWQLQLLNSLPYCAQCSVLIEGNLDVKTLKAALEQIVNRHEILHTIYNHLPGMTIPLQVITDSNIFWNEDLDISSCTVEEQEDLLKVLFYQASQESFNLQQGPLLKFSLIKQSPSQYILLVSLPAISADNTTLRNLVREISRSYAAISQGKKLDDEPLQYADLAEWQNNLLEGSDTEAGRDYWRKQDVSALPAMQLPFENQPACLLEFQPQSYKFKIEADFAAKIQALAQQNNASASEVFLASWQVLLWRLTGQKTLAVGILLDGRKHEELETAIGLFAKYLPIFVHLKEEYKLSEIIQQIHESKNHIYKWQEYFSWEQLVGFAQNSPESSFFPLCFEEDELRKYGIDDVSFSIYEQYTCIDRFKVKLCYTRQNDSLVAALHYDSNLFQAQDIQRLAGQFQTLLASLIEHPETAISQLEILSQIERQQLLVEFNNTELHYPLDKCIHQLFEEQSVSTPDKIALVFEDQQLTYREINARANQLGSYLHSLGVGPEVLVGLCLERSHQMVIGLLGILKAGGAWVPLDPTYPKERLAFMLQDVQVPVLLTQESLVGDLPEQKAQVVCLDKDWPLIYQMDEENLASGVTVDNLAYVIYTSGSTGKPKGLRITHANLCHYVQAMRISLGITAEDVYLHTASIAFSSSVRQLMVSLTQGSPVKIATSEQRKDPLVLFEGIKQHDVTIMDIVPSFWRNCNYTLAYLEPESRKNLLNNKLRLILTTGEALLSDIPTNWTFEFKHNARPINMFGQTETSGTVAVYPVSTSSEDRVKVVPLGRPIANTQIYLLDRHLIPVPMGVPGELYIGGFSLGQGYFNRPDLTAQNFIPNPFSSQPGSRLYKTGDLGRYLPDGNIEFLGRIDYLVNLRGFRIEPGEIEAVLSQHPSVREAVVLARKDETGEQFLAAYVVPSQVLPYTSRSGVNPSVLQSFLREKLPEYMVPSTYVVLEALPLTPTGKVNRPALPAPEQARPELDEAFVAPRTPVEQVLAGIWARCLSTEYVGIHDNFFSLGGHSLLATQVISQVREAFQVELRLRSLFETPTVAGLAEVIETALRAEQTLQLPPIERVSRDRELPLSFAQQRLWFLDQLEPGNPFYNISQALLLKGLLKVAALEQSLNEIVRRHEVLRTNFRDVDGRPVQEIASGLNTRLPIINLGELSQEEREAEVRQLARSQARQSFDLTQDALLRATLLRLEKEVHVLVFTVHHIVADGWSTGVIIHEITALYESFCSSKPSLLLTETLRERHATLTSLPELPVQYADFAIWQRQWLQIVQSSQMAYWKQQLGGNLPVLQLPTDRPRPAIQTFRGRKQPWQISKALTEALKSLSQREAVTLFMTLLTAFKTLLYRYTNQADILIGSPIANRNRSEIEGLIGFFVNTIVLRTDLSGNPSFKELLQRVREVTLDAYAHQDLPFEQLVEELQPERSLSYTPLFQVMLVLHNVPVEVLKLPDLSLSPMEVEPETALFDLTVYLTETQQGMMGYFEYNSDLFDTATIERMQGHFQTLLEGIVTNPDQHLFDLPILSATEQQQLLVNWNQTSADYPSICIHQLFEAQVEQTPNAIAVVFEDQQLTYQELNFRANQLAHYLRTLGVGPEVLVGICVERSLDMVVGLLGILKAGGAYVPLDPSYPQERLAFMIENSQPRVLLTQQHLVESLPDHRARVVCLDSNWGLIASERIENPRINITADNLAYVIYTSGSTGRPKGAMNTQRGICNRLRWMQEAYQLRATDKVLQKTPFSFDVSVWEFFWPLMTGASLVVAQPEGHRDPDYLVNLITQKQISTLHFVPSMLQMFLEVENLETCKCLKRVMASGEALPAQLQKRFFNRLSAQLHNLYGPTEAAVDVTYWACVQQSNSEQNNITHENTVPIGHPIANIQIYLLDQLLNPVPVGVTGEVYIGGVGVGRGYLNRPELTAEKFIPNPFSNKSASRLYKTGDLARYLPNGEIEYIGRIDHQVKVRGYRIELGEIEALLNQHPALQQAVVLAQEDQSVNKRLVAYVVQNLQYQSLEKLVSDTAWQNENISEWEVVFDQSYDQISQHQDPTFNITGWNSSYTNLPIPAAEMGEWVDHTVERILALQPRRVLEIGCGTGLLLFRVAPHCTQYWGTDISSVALNQIQQQLIIQEQKLPQVKLFQKRAEDFENVEAEAFDMVILNSVVQYFPSITYLLQVLESAVKKVESGGFIFVGDVRNLPLLDAFHASVQLHQALVSLSRSQLQQRVQKGIAQESELVIDPAFFIALKQYLPQITHVQIQPKRGDYHNELTKFRYDVILHVGSEVDFAQDFPWLDWHEQQLTLTSVRQLLQSTKPEMLGLRRVPNARLLAEVKTVELLANDSRSETVGDIQQALQSIDTRFGVNPEDLWALNHELPYAIDISWANAVADGSYDVILTRCSTARSAEFKEIVPSFPSEAVRSKPWTFYANNPLKAKLTRDIVPQLQRFLQQKLPEYMVPSAFVTLEALPLTPNGKVDRRTLAASGLTQIESEEIFVAPSTPVEEILAGIWAEVLDLDNVGIHDNFFELGGHSLLATRVISQIQKVFKLKLPLHRLFDKPTVAQLATELQKASKADSGLEATTIERISRSHELPLSFAQQRLWFLHQLEPDSVAYNGSSAVLLQGSLNVETLEKSINEIVRRHEALRTCFAVVEGLAVQRIASELIMPLPIIDLQNLTKTEHETELQQLGRVQTRRPFDLSDTPLIRLSLLRLGTEEHILIVTMHHIIFDAWSVGIFIREMSGLYEAFSTGKPSQLPELSIQYADFAVWQRQWLQKEVRETQLAYWKQQLDNLSVLQLPTDYPRSAVPSSQGATQSIVLPKTLSQELKALSVKQGVTLFMMLLAAFQTLLHWYTNQDDMIVGTDIANRNRSETEELIGFFINQLVLRTYLGGNPTFHELLERVREVTLGAYAHQDLPFNTLVEVFNPERHLNSTPLFQVKFILQNAPIPPLELSGLTVISLDMDQGTAEFDLLLQVTDTEQGLITLLKYNTDLFKAASIAQMLKEFETLLCTVAKQPDIELNALKAILVEANQQQRKVKEQEYQKTLEQKLMKSKRKLIR